MKKNKEEVCKNMKPLIEKILSLSSQIISMRSAQKNNMLHQSNIPSQNQHINYNNPLRVPCGNNLFIPNNQTDNNISFNNEPPPVILLNSGYVTLRKISNKSIPTKMTPKPKMSSRRNSTFPRR